MTTDDVYQEWKRQRSSIVAPNGFESHVMSGLVDSDGSEENCETSTRRNEGSLLSHPLWAAAAMVAASVVGIMRVTFALLIGILQ